ncbi:MAG: hypothetical protein JWO86_2606 [Myxococcaceae bacterium]|nr:hypothetical protein [Myxococcaceae bacterium]
MRENREGTERPQARALRVRACVVRTVLNARTMRRLGLGMAMSLAIAGVMLACAAPRPPAPRYVGHPTEALQQAAYPPPPARVEFMPDIPKPNAVWIDGEWTWQGRRYAWKQGRWLVAPPNARFSPWTSTRDKSGIFYIAEGKWRDPQGRELPDPPPLVLGRTRGGPVVNPEGEPVAATPNVAPGTPSGSSKADAGAAAGGPETPTGATPTGTLPKSGGGAEAGTGNGVEASDGGLVEAGSDASPVSPRMVPQ